MGFYSIATTATFCGRSVKKHKLNHCAFALEVIKHEMQTISKRLSSTNNAHQHQRTQRRKNFAAAVLATAFSMVGLSIYTRHLRREKLTTLTPAAETGLIISSSTESSPTQAQPLSIYNIDLLVETITRAGLVGTEKSVKDEIDYLRKWHIDRGYNGGLVVRDLTRPLFNSEMNKSSAANDTDMNQRECYYLYYEIHSNGETRQQLFCRGTTLLSDVVTCLQTWFDYDEELGCRVHHGFNEHANRIVEDVIPLLVPPSNKSTIEVCGHSLGGAVAMLVAIKLRKRGYFVSKVTSVGGPRFCRGIKERDVLEKWLPNQTIRIEDDLDLVTYLPPIGVSVGDKLWLVSDTFDGEPQEKVFMLPRQWMEDKSGMSGFTESVWLNLRLLESLSKQHITHRVASYAKKLKRIHHKPDES